VRTSGEYLESLVDGRVTWFEGNRVADPLAEPLLAQAARVVAAGYDQWYDPGANVRNPLMTAPACEADLRARVPMLLASDFALDLSYQALMALSTAGAALSEVPGRNTTFAPRHEDARTFPYSSQHHIPDGFVVFDDVFVPDERVFLDGQSRYAAVFAHNLGMWQRLGSLAFTAADADRMVGFAQLIAEANGLARVAHVTEKISELMIHATMVRAGLEAAIANCETKADGVCFPSELYTNAAKYHAAANAPLMTRHIHDIAGGSLVTAPSIADLENPEIGPAVRKYMTTGERADGEYRLRLFHALRDLTADAYGAWRLVTNMQGGGGLYAQRIVTRKHFDMAAAKDAALRYVGLAPPS
jgi:4-hydroxybutyryl-CoA dehydratase/vinylacetyl-CoA-Delta-isomerase